MRRVGPDEWFVKDEGDYIIMSGGVIDTDSDVVAKASELLHRPIKRDAVTVVRMHRNYANTVSYYYGIEYLDNTDNDKKDDISSKLSKFIKNDNRRSYYKAKRTHIGFARRLIVKDGLLYGSVWFLSGILGFFLDKINPAFLAVLGSVLFWMAFFSILLRDWILSMPNISRIPVRNGFVYVLNNDAYITNHDFEDDSKTQIEDKNSDKIFSGIKKKWLRRHHNANIELRKENVEACFNRSSTVTFITVTDPSIHNNVDYYANEVIRAYKGTVLGLKKSSKAIQDPSDIIELYGSNKDMLDKMSELRDEINSLESTAFADSKISTIANNMVSTFISSQNISRKAGAKIIKQLTDIRDNLRTLSNDSTQMDSALDDLHELIRMRSQS